MATMEAPAASTWSIDANYGMELDSILRYVVEGRVPDGDALRSDITELAESEHKVFAEVKLHLGLRFAANRKDGRYDEEKIAKISPAVKSFLGLNAES